MKTRLFKKVVGAVAVMSLVLTAGTSAFAATSPIADIPYQPVETEVATTEVTATVNGQAVEVKVEASTTTQEAPKADEIYSILDAAEANGELVEDVTIDENTKVVAVQDVVLRAADGTVISGALEAPVDIVFNVEGVKTGDSIVVLNYYDGAWHYVEATVSADGQVTATFNHLSPVAFVVTPATAPTTPEGNDPTVTDKKPSTQASGNKTTATTTTKTASTAKTSPKTGE